MRDPLSRLRCPVCLTGGLASAPAPGVGLGCAACRATFPSEGGVGVLVADPSAHEADLVRARAVNPDWYLVEQPPEQASPWRHHLRKRRIYVERVLRRELTARGRDRAEALLDLGCGDGNNLVWLQPLAETLYGSDYNAIRLCRAQAQVPGATLFLADILDYPAFDGAFDVVYFNHVLEHIPDDRAALATVYRILAPGGLLVLGTPNEGAWWWQLAYRRAPEVLATTDHVHFYTADTLVETMRHAGFLIGEVRHIGWGPPDWQLDGRLRRYKMLDDVFELIGKAILPRQASSLYVIASKTLAS